MSHTSCSATVEVFHEFCRKQNIHVIGTFPECWIPSPHIQRFLGLVNIHNNTSNFPQQYKKIMSLQTNRGLQNTLFFSVAALKILLSKSRKAKAQEFARVLNFDIDSYHCVPVETETLTFLQDVFRDETIVFQQPFGVYRVDMFFPKYNLAVECDEESTHNSTEERKNDGARQAFIEEQFGCRFVRYRPQSDKHALATTIRQIYQHFIWKAPLLTQLLTT